jgi:(S)-ureidoglycine aminohydrolase
MKFYKNLLPFLICLVTASYAQPLVSKVYSWDNSKAIVSNTGSSRNICSGSGSVLTKHEIKGITLSKGKSIIYNSDSPDERFFIVKTGPLKITINDSSAILDRGSVASVLLGDRVVIENTGNTAASFYEINYQSIAPPNNDRGKKAGGSFMIDWNAVTFKPHDKGGVRQFFDRPTTMLSRFDIHVTQLNMGFKSHDPHTHKNEEIILMLDGNAEMQIGADHQKANAGDVVFLESMISHNLTNIGNTPCLYFAIQWN